MDFEYLRVTQTLDSISVEDVGNCAIKAFNDLGVEYILIIDTQLGTSRVFHYGPIVLDTDLLPKSVSCTFKRINWDAKKIQKVIREFLNNPIYNITQAEVIEREEALKDCKSLIEYMKQDILY